MSVLRGGVKILNFGRFEHVSRRTLRTTDNTVDAFIPDEFEVINIVKRAHEKRTKTDNSLVTVVCRTC
jgi:hypothetical protein